jgi:tetratricopeptide (TPR) repeat protein
LGQLTEAQGHYAESLALRRQIQQQLGDSPQTGVQQGLLQGVLRDISVSLNKLGDITQALGNLSEAQGLFAESLALRRQIQQQLGDSPKIGELQGLLHEALRDISVSLGKLGEIALALGNLSEAQGLFTESLALCRQRQQLLGDSPQVLQDICSNQICLGRVKQQMGDEAAVAEYFNASLGLLAQLQILSPAAAFIEPWRQYIRQWLTELGESE